MARGRDSRTIFGLRSLDHLASRLLLPLRQTAQQAPEPTNRPIPPAENASALRACPVRFQCSGCPSYRPDPSHLPAIEDQVRSLRANLEVAVTMGAASYTIQGMEGEIADYKVVIAKMTEKLAGMSDEERHEVEEASRTLRRLRAGASSSSVALPMPTFRRPGHEEGS